jgi:hypothetical protein
VWSVSRSEGSAVTDFVLVAFPLLAVFVATTSITFGSYARSVLLDSTIEGARYAALADQDIPSGIAKTKELVAAALGPSLSINVAGHPYSSGSIQSVRLVSTLGFSFFPGSDFLSVSSVATRENEY